MPQLSLICSFTCRSTRNGFFCSLFLRRCIPSIIIFPSWNSFNNFLPGVICSPMSPHRLLISFVSILFLCHCETVLSQHIGTGATLTRLPFHLFLLDEQLGARSVVSGLKTQRKLKLGHPPFILIVSFLFHDFALSLPFLNFQPCSVSGASPKLSPRSPVSGGHRHSQSFTAREYHGQKA
jgi:hypothetical protein